MRDEHVIYLNAIAGVAAAPAGERTGEANVLNGWRQPGWFDRLLCLLLRHQPVEQVCYRCGRYVPARPETF